MTADLDGGGYRIENVGDLITGGPWVDARIYSSGVQDETVLNAAFGAIGSDNKTLLLAGGAWAVNNSLTVPANIVLRFEAGSYLSIASGVTVTIYGKIDAGIQQIFSGEGTVEFNFGQNADVASYMYPQWWGAVTGDTDDSVVMARNAAALSNAIKWGKAFLPDGIYKVNAGAGNVYAGKITGAGMNRSIIKTDDPTVTLLEVRYDCTVKDVGFIGGKYAISITTNNLDRTMIKFENCYFEGQSDASIFDNYLNSSAFLIIDTCKFVTSLTGMVLNGGFDGAVIRDSWIDLNSPLGIINRGPLKIKGLHGRASNSDSDACWIRHDTGHLGIEDSEFLASGDTGRCIVENYAAVDRFMPTEVVVRDSVIFVSEDHAFKFYELPDQVLLEHNGPYVFYGGKGIYIDDAVSANTRERFGIDGTFQNTDKIPLFGSSELTQLLNSKDYDNFNLSTVPLVTDMIFCMGFGDSGWGGYSTAGQSTIVFPYNYISGREYSATGDSQYFYYLRNLPDTILSDGCLYTAVVDVINHSDTPKRVFAAFGDTRREFTISQGLSILAVPSYWVTGKSTTAKIEAYNLQAGDTLQFGRYRLFKGNHRQDSVNTVMYGTTTSSVPSNPYVKFYLGDRIVYMDASAGGALGRQCTSAGAPGAWKDYGVISP